MGSNGATHYQTIPVGGGSIIVGKNGTVVGGNNTYANPEGSSYPPEVAQYFQQQIAKKTEKQILESLNKLMAKGQNKIRTGAEYFQQKTNNQYKSPTQINREDAQNINKLSLSNAQKDQQENKNGKIDKKTSDLEQQVFKGLMKQLEKNENFKEKVKLDTKDGKIQKTQTGLDAKSIISYLKKQASDMEKGYSDLTKDLMSNLGFSDDMSNREKSLVFDLLMNKVDDYVYSQPTLRLNLPESMNEQLKEIVNVTNQIRVNKEIDKTINELLDKYGDDPEKIIDEFFKAFPGLYGSYGVDQSIFTRMKVNNDHETQDRFINLVKNKYNMSFRDAAELIDALDSIGACSYADVANGIIAHYKDKPKEFEKDFGFPLYIVNEKGELGINDTELLFDLYFNVNHMENGRKFDPYRWK